MESKLWCVDQYEWQSNTRFIHVAGQDWRDAEVIASDVPYQDALRIVAEHNKANQGAECAQD
jgi:hypothetical protein